MKSNRQEMSAHGSSELFRYGRVRRPAEPPVEFARPNCSAHGPARPAGRALPDWSSHGPGTWILRFWTQPFQFGTSQPPHSILRLCLAIFACMLAAGCAATRPISDAALGAGGAIIASELSDGNPLATAAGAAGGVLVSEGLHFAAQKQAQKAYQTGYDKGRSDAVKQQYWLYVASQRASGGPDRARLYEVQLPEQQIDGVIFKPSTKYLRIDE